MFRDSAAAYREWPEWRQLPTVRDRAPTGSSAPTAAACGDGICERHGCVWTDFVIGARFVIVGHLPFSEAMPSYPKCEPLAQVSGNARLPVLRLILPARLEAEGVLAVHRADRVPIEADVAGDGVDVAPGTLDRV
jgi:hypothetical protein